MDQTLWTNVDNWFAERLHGSDDALAHALAETERAGLRAINVSPALGKLLQLLVIVRGARRILEVGTLGGYSSIWMARALPPDGRLITLEVRPETAELARKNLAYAGLQDIVDVRLGRARDLLERLTDEGPEPFDVVFIDADKENNPHYLEWALKLTKPGSIIIIDNVVRSGYILDPDETDRNVVGVRRTVEMIAAEPRVSATALQTVGVKDYDGFLIAVVLSK